MPWKNPVVHYAMQGLDILAQANTLLVALTVGAALVFNGFGGLLLLAGLVCLIKLALKPVLLWLSTLGMALPPRQGLVLEGAMSPGPVAGGLVHPLWLDAGLASRLVFATSVLCGVISFS